MPAQESKFWIPTEEPVQAIDRFLDAVLNKITTGNMAQEMHVTSNAGRSLMFSQPRNLEQIKASDEYRAICTWVSKPHSGFREIQLRTTQHGHLSFCLRREILNDQVVIAWDDSHNVHALLVSVMDSLSSSYQVVPDQRRAQQARDHVLNLQDGLVTQLVQRMTESSAMLDHSVKDALQTLIGKSAEADAQLRSKIDAERKVLEREREASNAAFRAERESFDREKQAFNDKKSTLVRRDLLEKISQKLNEQGRAFTFSDQTKKLAKPIMTVCSMMITVGIIGMVYFGYLVYEDSQLALHHTIPLAAFSLLFASTSIYLVRWLNSWLYRHASMETKNQLLHYDMLRASWFAELLFEYRDESGKPASLPDSVIQVMTKNLFEDVAAEEQAKHPADDVTAFLKRLSRLKVSEEGVEMETSKAASKK